MTTGITTYEVHRIEDGQSVAMVVRTPKLALVATTLRLSALLSPHIVHEVRCDGQAVRVQRRADGEFEVVRLADQEAVR